MKVAVVANDDLKQELMSSGIDATATIEWISDINFIPGQSDVVIDLLFDTDRKKRMEYLNSAGPALLIVNDVEGTTEDLPVNYVRINGWPTFLKRSIIEISGSNKELKEKTEKVIAVFSKKAEWVPDIPGFISARVASTIINEAYFSIEDEISSRDDIDTAMKLGTNYPYGPFEWSKLIGLKRIYCLLEVLSKENSRYIPSDLLKKEAKD